MTGRTAVVELKQPPFPLTHFYVYHFIFHLPLQNTMANYVFPSL